MIVTDIVSEHFILNFHKFRESRRTYMFTGIFNLKETRDNMAVRNIFVILKVLKAVTASMLKCMVSCNLPRILLLKFGFNICSSLKYTGNSRPNHNIILN